MSIIGGAEPAPATITTEPTPGEPATGSEIKYPESFPAEFHGNANVMKFYDKEAGDFNYGNMMTSLIHAQKLVGGDKILVPNKDSSADDWKNVFNKLGLPGREDYKLNIEGVDETADDMTKGFIDKAHELGILPQQAKGVVEYFNEAQKGQETQSDLDAKDASALALNNLKAEWKGTYDDNIAAVNDAVDKIFTAEEKQVASDAGYFSDPLFVKMMHTVSGKLLDDSTLSGQAPRIGGFEGEQALRDEYQTVMNKMAQPEFKNSPALQRRLTHALEQAAAKGIEIYR